MTNVWTVPEVLDAEHVEDAVSVLQRYFAVGEDGFPMFTGSMFERFDGGGDRIEIADRFTAADCVAVTMLSVDVPAAAALRVLDPARTELNDLLRQLPCDLELANAGEHHLELGEELWGRIRRSGVGPVTTSKLLARKRPHLLPVIDTIVKRVLHHPRRGNFYRTLRNHLVDNDHELYRRLEQIRADAHINSDISIIRSFDIIVWMTGRYPLTGPRNLIRST